MKEFVPWKVTQLALIACLTLCVATGASAFDGERKGFILGLGVGPGLVSMEDSDTKFGFMTDFKIGYAPNNRLQIHYVNKVAWYSEKWVSCSGWSCTLEDFTTIQGLTGGAVTYSFQPVAPSPFITGGIGVAITAAPFESGSDSYTGFGLFGGAGYEFAPHWNLQGDITYGKPGKYGANFSVLTFRVTINVLGY